MALTTLTDTRVQAALRNGVSAMKRLANYRLPAALDRRLRELGERKDFFGADDHEELLALVTFSHERAVDKLEAELALREFQNLLT